MIKARHTGLHVRFFRVYSRVMLHRHFSRVIIKEEFADKGLPVLLIGNHFSWWDGFIANYLNNRLFKRQFHIMMLEDQLRKRMFLNKAGAFSIQKGSRSVIESLSYAADLLKNSRNLVVLYPQGQFQSLYDRHIKFEKGFISILRDTSPTGYQVLFYVALVDYFNERKPILTLNVREYDHSAGLTVHELETAYNSYYASCITGQKELL